MSDHQPLADKRIAITRARHQAPPLEALIVQHGGIAVAYPCLEIKLPSDTNSLDACLRQLSQYDWLVLSSGNAVWALAERARATGIALDMAQLQVAVIGPATATALSRHFSRAADFMPSEASAQGLAEELPMTKRQRLLLPQSHLAEPQTAGILRSRGAEVRALLAYRAVMGRGGADLPGMIAASQIDALTFASPSALRYFRQRCPLDEALRLPACCLGPATAKAARALGFQDVFGPAKASLPAMVDALSQRFASQ